MKYLLIILFLGLSACNFEITTKSISDQNLKEQEINKESVKYCIYICKPYRAVFFERRGSCICEIK